MTGCAQGVVVKNTQDPYHPGKAGWVKVKVKESAEYVIGGITGSLAQPPSLLLSRYDRRGTLRYLSQTHQLRAVQRREVAGLRR